MISRNDILDLESFEKTRSEKRKNILLLKKDRRIHVGPDITLHFENKDTILWQIHEMLRIEKGGEDQLIDELSAYAPLAPHYKGHHKVMACTLMIEIVNPIRRKEMLSTLTHIENFIYISSLNERIQAQPIEDHIDRTNEMGKTSSVHFMNFRISQKAEDIMLENPIMVHIEHPAYRHSTQLTEQQKTALLHDLHHILL